MGRNSKDGSDGSEGSEGKEGREGGLAEFLAVQPIVTLRETICSVEAKTTIWNEPKTHNPLSVFSI